ncbi:MAG TPA: hypothetical protein DHW20_01830 [Gemmatimonadetes bacterium]|nr:hypothetical protein [Gemmatimonadota bacterium]
MTSAARLADLAQRGIDSADWYDQAAVEIADAAKRLTDELGRTISPKYLADILAITSPRVAVRRNIRLALAYIRSGGTVPSGILPTVAIALRRYQQDGIVRGAKVSPFARAILGDSQSVVLDVWMARALNIAQPKLSGLAVHRRASSRVNTAARILNDRLGTDHQPAAVQAMIWASVVTDAGRAVARFNVSDHL